MKKKVHLELTNPCQENWNAMTPDNEGRYCRSCCKTVVDFTTMTDREIVDYISHYAIGNTCARVYDNQLNRTIQEPSERTFSWKYFWSIALGGLLMAQRSAAQVKPPKDKPAAVAGQPAEKKIIRLGGVTAKVLKDTITTTISGRVLNEQDIPIPFASIALDSSDRVFVADVEGRYSFSIRSEQVAFTRVTITAAGYEPYTYMQVPADSIQSIEIVGKEVKINMKDFSLKQKPMKEAVVIAYGVTTERVVMGGISSGIRVSTFQQCKDRAAALFGRKDLLVYPNPAPANGSFRVRFNMKQAGEYNVQFIDVAGRIVGGRRVMVATPGQTESFDGALLPGRGAYFVRVAGRADGKVYDVKMVVQ